MIPIHRHQWEDLSLWKQHCVKCGKKRQQPVRRMKRRTLWEVIKAWI